MKKKIIIISVITFIAVIILGGYILYHVVLNDLTGNVKLKPDEYLTSVEVKSKSNFILFINKKNKVSNIIFLNGYSINTLYKQKIEGKNIETAIELIVDKLKNGNDFNDIGDIQLIDYGNKGIYNEVKTEFNKQLVIYGVDKNITDGSTTLKDKLVSLNYDVSDKDTENLKKLYDISINLISQYRDEKLSNNKINIENDFSIYANNIYNKLENYAKEIPNQEKDSPDGLDITTVNASGDYQNELYVSKDSWYYVADGKVFSYIKFDYNNEIHEYCYKGTNNYTEGIC